MPDITQESTDPHYAAIGRVAATWASFEHDIQSEIWTAAGVTNPVGACITAQIGNSARLLDCLVALLALRGTPEPQLKELRSFSSEVDQMQRTRNRIVHDTWYLRFRDDDAIIPDAYRIEISAKKKLIFGIVPHSTAELDKFINDTIKMKHRLRRLMSSNQMPLP
jgi:hypothetical protein